MKTSKFIGLILLAGCNLVPDNFSHIQTGNDTAVVLKTTYVSNTSSDVTFDADVTFLVGSSDYVSIGYLDKNSLKFGGSGTYTILDFKSAGTQTSSTASSLVLIDQSGSYTEQDSKNMRSKVINKYLHDVKSPSSFALGGFSKGGKLDTEPLELGNDFSSEASAVVPYLFDLPARTGGQCVLFDALAQAIEKIKASPGSHNIVVLAHSTDEGSVATLSSVTAAALLNQVAVHILLLASPVCPLCASPVPNPDATVMAKLSQSTGGIFSMCTTEKEMITAFNHLNYLLTVPGLAYTVRVKYAPGGAVTSGMETFHQFLFHDSHTNLDFNPALHYVKIP